MVGRVLVYKCPNSDSDDGCLSLVEIIGCPEVDGIKCLITDEECEGMASKEAEDERTARSRDLEECLSVDSGDVVDDFDDGITGLDDDEFGNTDPYGNAVDYD